MTLPETFESIRPSIIMFASRFVRTKLGGKPLFPTIIGTGFVVESCGIVATNRHVAEALLAQPKHPEKDTSSALALIPIKKDFGDLEGMGYVMADITMHWLMTTFKAPDPYYGADQPDLAFLQLEVKDLPVVELVRDGEVLKTGIPIATAGFPLGTPALTVFGKVNQLSPFLRHGIVSSVFPFPCTNPHGFTMDAMVQGGASGSPVFLPDSGKVVGIVHAGFGNTNLTLCVPSPLIAAALESLLKESAIEFSNLKTIDELLEEAEKSNDLSYDSFVVVDGKLVKVNEVRRDNSKK